MAGAGGVAATRPSARVSSGAANPGPGDPRQTRPGGAGGENTRGNLYAALYLTWVGGSVLRRGAPDRRCHDDLDTYAGRVSGSASHRRDARTAEGKSALHS